LDNSLQLIYEYRNCETLRYNDVEIT